MTKPKLPRMDSIRKLAEFWDTHDLTDFQDELEEVHEPIFVRKRGTTIDVPLEEGQRKAVAQMAQAKGLSPQQLVRQWVVQKLSRRNSGRPTKRSA